MILLARMACGCVIAFALAPAAGRSSRLALACVRSALVEACVRSALVEARVRSSFVDAWVERLSDIALADGVAVFDGVRFAALEGVVALCVVEARSLLLGLVVLDWA